MQLSEIKKLSNSLYVQTIGQTKNNDEDEFNQMSKWTLSVNVVSKRTSRCFKCLETFLFSTVKEMAAGDDEEEGTSGQPPSKRLKVEPEKKKEKRHKVDEDEIQKMQ